MVSSPQALGPMLRVNGSATFNVLTEPGILIRESGESQLCLMQYRSTLQQWSRRTM